MRIWNLINIMVLHGKQSAFIQSNDGKAKKYKSKSTEKNKKVGFPAYLVDVLFSFFYKKDESSEIDI